MRLVVPALLAALALASPVSAAGIGVQTSRLVLQIPATGKIERSVVVNVAPGQSVTARIARASLLGGHWEMGQGAPTPWLSVSPASETASSVGTANFQVAAHYSSTPGLHTAEIVFSTTPKQGNVAIGLGIGVRIAAEFGSGYINKANFVGRPVPWIMPHMHKFGAKVKNTGTAVNMPSMRLQLDGHSAMSGNTMLVPGQTGMLRLSATLPPFGIYRAAATLYVGHHVAQQWHGWVLAYARQPLIIAGGVAILVEAVNLVALALRRRRLHPPHG